jgi:hypothetical protein
MPDGISLRRNMARKQDNDLKALLAQVIPQTVRINAGRYQGSGFIIRDGQREGRDHAGNNK